MFPSGFQMGFTHVSRPWKLEIYGRGCGQKPPPARRVQGHAMGDQPGFLCWVPSAIHTSRDRPETSTSDIHCRRPGRLLPASQEPIPGTPAAWTRPSKCQINLYFVCKLGSQSIRQLRGHGSSLGTMGSAARAVRLLAAPRDCSNGEASWAGPRAAPQPPKFFQALLPLSPPAAAAAHLGTLR